jgi:acyl-CoA-binding protein
METVMSAFEKAQADVKTLSSRPSNEDMLFLYAHFKQASSGDVSGKRPGMLDMVARAKYDAWAKLEGMSPKDAEAKYIARVAALLKAG